MLLCCCMARPFRARPPPPGAQPAADRWRRASGWAPLVWALSACWPRLAARLLRLAALAGAGRRRARGLRLPDAGPRRRPWRDAQKPAGPGRLTRPAARGDNRRWTASFPAFSRPATCISAIISARSATGSAQRDFDCIFCIVDLHALTPAAGPGAVSRRRRARSPPPISPPASIPTPASSSTRARSPATPNSAGCSAASPPWAGSTA